MPSPREPGPARVRRHLELRTTVGFVEVFDRRPADEPYLPWCPARDRVLQEEGGWTTPEAFAGVRVVCRDGRRAMRALPRPQR